MEKARSQSYLGNDILEDLVSVITENADYADKLIFRNARNSVITL